MSRPKKDKPEYKYHVSGQARVYIDGRYIYLGAYDSPESWAKYRRIVGHYFATGQAPDDGTDLAGDLPLTVADVAAEARQWIKTHFANDPVQQGRFGGLCTLLEDECGDLPANDFGPRKLAELRELFIASGNARKYVNSQVNNIVRIFRYALSRELIDASVIVRLQSLESLRKGKTTAKERPPVKPANIDDVRKTAALLSPPLRAMVRIQAATGMRPSELCAMRPCDIDMSDDSAWVYRPSHHKTAHLGVVKAVPIMNDARDAIIPFLSRNPEAFCFSPAESIEWHRQQRAAARKTPANEGNRRGKGSRKDVKNDETSRRPGKCFTRDSYRRAITQAAKKAKVSHWFPYQLRHLAGTVVRDALGAEAAQALLGHKRLQMTEHYAKVSERKAIEAADAAPSLGKR